MRPVQSYNIRSGGTVIQDFTGGDRVKQREIVAGINMWNKEAVLSVQLSGGRETNLLPPPKYTRRYDF